MQTNVKMSDDVEEEKEKSTLELSKVDFPYCIIQKDKSQSSYALLGVKPAFSRHIGLALQDSITRQVSKLLLL